MHFIKSNSGNCLVHEMNEILKKIIIRFYERPLTFVKNEKTLHKLNHIADGGGRQLSVRT